MTRTHRVLAISVTGAIALAAVAVLGIAQSGDREPTNHRGGQYRGMIGADSKKIRTDNGKTYLWAGGKPSAGTAEWYDFTGAEIPAGKLQFGIGKDRIRAIDDPLFVAPDDARLLKVAARSGYRPKEQAETNDEIMVIGYAAGDEARAYPVALLDRHELVNDTIGGKPLAVGW